MNSHSKRAFARAALAAAGFIAGLTPQVHAQDQLWLRQFGTSAKDIAFALAPDGAGGVMVAGETWGNLGGPHAGGGDVFLARYTTGVCYPDCDQSGALDIFDFLCFQNAFVAGCP